MKHGPQQSFKAVQRERDEYKARCERLEKALRSLRNDLYSHPCHQEACDAALAEVESRDSEGDE